MSLVSAWPDRCGGKLGMRLGANLRPSEAKHLAKQALNTPLLTSNTLTCCLPRYVLMRPIVVI